MSWSTPSMMGKFGCGRSGSVGMSVRPNVGESSRTGGSGMLCWKGGI